jgi:hypothetical protein
MSKVLVERHKLNGKIYYAKKSKTPARAIRLFCYECMGADRRKKQIDLSAGYQIKNCTDFMCPLFEFRFGKNPHVNRKGNIEHLSSMRERKAQIEKTRAER